DGEVVTMGDFNEVRYKFDRFGLVFNVQGADVFNSFIANAGLEEVPLGGNTWSEAHGDDSNAMRNMMRKLKYLKELEAVDAAIDKGNGSDEIVNKRMEVINSMHQIDKIQAMDMAQKAKIKWSIEGDENSWFFHGVLNKKRSQLNIRGIMVDGMDLERDVSKKELKKAMWDCGMDKSPGPDGFTFGFYRHFWPTVENDVFEAVKHFFTYGDIPKGCDLSFIALIQKIPDANLVKDFRPISLIGNIYKIIAKILVNRLVGVLGDIVNEVQSAFIAERQILDGPSLTRSYNGAN
nr:RNA-directed DNA polymerase, eukaryota [Tanacetum cinerariifolium]